MPFWAQSLKASWRWRSLGLWCLSSLQLDKRAVPWPGHWELSLLRLAPVSPGGINSKNIKESKYTANNCCWEEAEAEAEASLVSTRLRLMSRHLKNVPRHALYAAPWLHALVSAASLAPFGHFALSCPTPAQWAVGRSGLIANLLLAKFSIRICLRKSQGLIRGGACHCTLHQLSCTLSSGH